MTAKEIESVERESLDGAIAFLLKLPETTFRPLYLKVSIIETTDARVACSFIFRRHFQINESEFQTFAYNSRTARSSYVKF